jgi:hypothetical protein
VIVEALKVHRAGGFRRLPGERFHANAATGKHLVDCQLARVVLEVEDWTTPMGRELRVEPVLEPAWPMVVACLNIWNDQPALAQTLPTWLEHVDALVVADGPYKSTGVKAADSTDGLWEYLEPLVYPRLLTRLSQAQPWPDQNAKRSALLQAAAEQFPGALLFIVDADEFVTGAEQLRTTPFGDVAWLTVSSPLYQRPYGQPRLVRAQPRFAYRGRHHWLYAGDRLLATHQYGGTGVEHRTSPVQLRNARGLGHDAARAKAKRTHMQVQSAAEAPATTAIGEQSDRAVGARENLRIASCTTYDPGLVGFRFHTALNATTPHTSVFLRRGMDNPFQGPRQYDVDHDLEHAKRLLEEADVVHCHMDYTVVDSLGVRPRALVIHHHGTMFRKLASLYDAMDHLRAGLRLVSNLELLSYGLNLHWLPNPMPVARMRRLRAQEYRPTEWFRIAHSPSKRDLKGTDLFLAACAALSERGLPVQPVLIEGVALADSLRMKATCDAAFDSFWLGLQCSGLEAGAMGLPVIAGDPLVRERYQEHVGEVPYIYANDGPALQAAIERLVTDPRWAASEGARLGAYVEAWHDEAAVALRYLNLLDDAIEWRSRMALTPLAEATVTPTRARAARVG